MNRGVETSDMEVSVRSLQPMTTVWEGVSVQSGSTLVLELFVANKKHCPLVLRIADAQL